MLLHHVCGIVCQLSCVGDVVPGVVVYLTSSLIIIITHQWAHEWTDSGCLRRPQYADVRAHCKKAKKQCKEGMYVCPLNHDITTLHYITIFNHYVVLNGNLRPTFFRLARTIFLLMYFID